ncbi:MAG: PadR family transcriptional regulator [Propionibacteriaceae bacterium]|jgi:DNA-binding PadR family transcriptional regulator|nr:PadR family transcriptional regulator [Propionibacteriaceae bacterium]
MTDMNTSTTLLGLLGTGPSYGYDLKQDYDRLFGSKRALAYGQVYATLARLVKAGYILLLGGEAGAGPDRKRYEITPQGRTHLETWMFTPDVPSEALQSNLFAKTVIALLLDDDAERLLDLQRRQHMARMRELTKEKQAGEIGTVLLCDHALFHIEADLRWIELTAARLGELRTAVTA